MAELSFAPQTQICARCGAIYQGTRHSRYCTNACRQAAYRARLKYKVAEKEKVA